MEDTEYDLYGGGELPPPSVPPPSTDRPASILRAGTAPAFDQVFIPKTGAGIRKRSRVSFAAKTSNDDGSTTPTAGGGSVYYGGSGAATPEEDPDAEAHARMDAAMSPAARRAAARKRRRTVAPETFAAHVPSSSADGGAVVAARELLAEGYVAWAKPKSDPDAFIIASVEGGARSNRYIWAGGGRDPRKHLGANPSAEMLSGGGSAAGATDDEGRMVVHEDDVVGSTGTEQWEELGGNPASGGINSRCPPGPRVEITLAHNEHAVLEPPHAPTARQILVVSGPAGVGKSTLACDYLIRWRSLRPDAPAYLITALEGEDESLPSSKSNSTLNLIKLNLRKLVLKPMPIKMLRGALVIVDDVESMKKDEQKTVRALVEQICVRGRSHAKGVPGTSLIICMHLPSNRDETRTLLNECDTFVFFPSDPGSYGTMLTALQRYIGLSESQAHAALRERSRFLAIHKSMPRVFISDGRLAIMPRPFAEKAAKAGMQ